jgi:uncharacterized repeat protein (TIGR04138 family)
MHHPKVEELFRRDPRFPPEAYEFVRAALNHTAAMLGLSEAEDDGHVSARQLLDGVRDLARREFGLMARAVFRMWNIRRTDDVGDIVFNLVDVGLVSAMPHEARRDFQDVYDLDELTRDYAIEAPAKEPEDV